MIQLPSVAPSVLESLPTPALVVDLATAKSNIDQADRLLAASGVTIRPHFKAHKCVDLLRLQLDSNAAVGVTCATAFEALVLAESGFSDILIANEVVGERALEELARAASMAAVRVAIDSMSHAALLDATLPSDVTLGVLLEVDVGNHRCGVDPEDAQIERILQSVAASARLRFDGLMGYEGHAVLEEDAGIRLGLVKRAASTLDRVRQRVESAGFECAVVSGGGTGTCDMAAATGVFTEIQAGSYVLMDAAYARLNLPFRPALFCVAHVVTAYPDRAVANAGLKALSVDQGLPILLSPAGSVIGLADEHSRLVVSDSHVGDLVWLQPSHVDPTVAMHDFMYVWDEEAAMQTWPVSRGRTRHNSVGTFDRN